MLHYERLTISLLQSEERDQQGKLVEKPRHPFYFKRIARHYLLDDIRKENRKATLTAATYHKKSKLLVTAYSTGAFYLHELPEVSLIHSLSISEYAIDTACFNPTGDWIALGAAGLGQLLVWEWQSMNTALECLFFMWFSKLNLNRQVNNTL